MANTKIMLIDDDDISLFVTQHLLKKVGYSTDSILMPSGFTALDYINDNLSNMDAMPDIIILDIEMPLVDGWLFVNDFQKIKSRINKKIAIYILSGNNIDEKSKEYIRIGLITKCFSKPLKIKDIEFILCKN